MFHFYESADSARLTPVEMWGDAAGLSSKPLEAHEYGKYTHGPRATMYGTYAKTWLMPVLYVIFNLLREAAFTIVLFVEGGIQVMDNHAEVALQ
jgi:hypothetical protein